MEAGVTFMLERVTEVILYYGHLIGSADKELKLLEKDLESLKSFLVELVHKTQKGPILKQLEKEMKELVYEVEDTLDTSLMDATAAAAAATPKKNWCCIGKLAPKSINMAERIQSLRESVKAMIGKANGMQVGGGSVSGIEDAGTLVTKDPSIGEDKVVGFEDEEKTINDYLKEPTKKLDVISIGGLPGQGKTTLTWKIFNSENIKHQFPNIRIWFNVSQKLNMKDLCLTILRKFTTGEDMSKLNDHDLKQKVQGYLKDKTFLIVLDDVWTVADWESIKKVLPMSNCNGKIIITTRMNEVGIAASTRGPHELRFLTPEESWILLQVKVFADVDVYPTILKDVGEKVAKSCDGMPLTMVVIGGILKAKSMRNRQIGQIKNDWAEVSKDVTHFIRTDKENHVSKVVALSYDILPDELRECFLYMGVFPEDYEIPAWTLTRLWIAEGFIQKREKESLEETAELYLNDLISRNLLMVGRINPMGENKTCYVHDIIRAFCTSKAEEQNLFKEIKKFDQGVLEPTVAEIHKYHRLCIHSELTMFLSKLKVFLSENPRRPSIRSFLCFYKDPVNLHPEYRTAIPDAFKTLRVLDSKSIKLDDFPRMLINVLHLRYITLYVNELKNIPKAIAQLWNLQTLVVDTSSDTLMMDANLWRITQLRHLKTKSALVLQDHKWEGKTSENLQTLSNLSPESCTESVSNRAQNIKKLGIRGNLTTVDPKFLANLCRVERLKLVNEMFYELPNNDNMFCLPQSDGFPGRLKRLTLRKTSLRWKDMSKLAAIESLEVLKLKENAFTGTTWKAVGPGFLGLQFLFIENTNLVNWEASPDHFPVLTFLSLNKCENLKRIPLELAANLQRLDISFLCPSAIESAKSIKEQSLMDQEQQKLRYGAGFQLNLGPGCV